MSVPAAVPTPALRPAVSVVPIPIAVEVIRVLPTLILDVAVITPALTSPVTLPVKFLVIVAGSLSLLKVPVVMLAASARLVAVVAVPVTLPVTLPEHRQQHHSKQSVYQKLSCHHSGLTQCLQSQNLDFVIDKCEASTSYIILFRYL